MLIAVKTIEVGVETFSLILSQNNENKLARVMIKPEEKRQGGEGADVHPAASHRTKDTAEEPDREQDHSLPRAEVHNRVKCFSFMLPKKYL